MAAIEETDEHPASVIHFLGEGGRRRRKRAEPDFEEIKT
jgi:hypothetical protein